MGKEQGEAGLKPISASASSFTNLLTLKLRFIEDQGHFVRSSRLNTLYLQLPLSMKLILLLLAILAALLVLAIKFLPWWASLLLLVTALLAARWGVKFLLRRILTIPFKVKGKALSGAAVRVHGIRSALAPVPKSEDEDDEELHQRSEQLKWYYLDVSIRPTERAEDCNSFVAWEPGDLVLVPPTAKADDLENDFDSEACEIHEVKVYKDGQFGEDEEGKYVGAQRLEFYIGVQPNVKQLKFRYYFELFGLVNIPAWTAPPQATSPASPKPSLPVSSIRSDSQESEKSKNVEAIAALINRSLQPRGITAKVLLKDSCLKVMLESATIPDPKLLAPFIYKGISNLKIPVVQSLHVYGRQTGEKVPAWSESFTLETVVAPPPALSR